MCAERGGVTVRAPDGMMWEDLLRGGGDYGCGTRERKEGLKLVTFDGIEQKLVNKDVHAINYG